MLFPLLATRVLARNVPTLSRLIFRPTPTHQVTRSFGVSAVAYASTATPVSKKPAKKVATKKQKTSQATKKPVQRKQTKKATRKPKKAEKKIILGGRPELRPPKRPGHAYSLFIRKSFAGLHPPEGVSGPDFVRESLKQAAATWRTFTEEEKKPFVDEFAAAAAEYKTRREDYMKNIDPAVIKEINKRRAKKGKTRIRRKKSRFNSFTVYVVEELAKRPRAADIAESVKFVKEFGRSWQALSDEEKSAYKRKADEKNASVTAI